MANRQKTFLPLLDGVGLDFIKIVAALSMLVDHIDGLWFDREVVPMLLIGRTAFPLFCYAVAAAVKKKTDESLGGYVRGLMILALLCEPISVLTRDQDMMNVVFTLAAGAMCAGLVRRMKDWQIAAFYIFAMASMSLTLPMEFGLVGVALPSAMLLVLEGRRRFIPFLVALMFFVNMSGLYEMLSGGKPFADYMITITVIALAASLPPFVMLHIAQDLPGRGRLLSRYALHVFYPLHLLVLWVLGLVFFA